MLRSFSESLKLDYAQFLELEVFTRFGTMVDERTKRIIEHGRRIRAILAQPQFAPQSLSQQSALLCALTEGVLDGVPLDRIGLFRERLGPWLEAHCPAVAALDEFAPALDQEARTHLAAVLQDLARAIAA
jgi:F0F1-type ATP synthase alpha subunit